MSGHSPRQSTVSRNSFTHSQSNHEDLSVGTLADELTSNYTTPRPSVTGTTSSGGGFTGEDSGHRLGTSIISNDDLLLGEQESERDNDAVALAASLAKFAKRANEESGKGIEGEEGEIEGDDEDDDDSDDGGDKEDGAYNGHKATLPASLDNPSVGASQPRLVRKTIPVRMRHPLHPL